MQGKSVHDIAVQAVNGMADTDILWAMNNAITALTRAQNAGALQQMRNALVSDDRDKLEQMFRLSTQRRAAFDKKLPE